MLEGSSFVGRTVDDGDILEDILKLSGSCKGRASEAADGNDNDTSSNKRNEKRCEPEHSNFMVFSNFFVALKNLKFPFKTRFGDATTKNVNL